MSRQAILFTLLVALFCACQTTEPSITIEVKPEVVLLFENPPIYNDPHLNNSGDGDRVDDESGIIYVDFNGEVNSFNPASSMVDTLVIPTYKGYAEVEHYYRILESVEFVFAAGDTIIISYDDKKYPIARSLTTPYREYNMGSISSRWRLSNGFSCYGLLRSWYNIVLREKAPISLVETYNQFFPDKNTLIDNYKVANEQVISYLNQMKTDTLYRNMMLAIQNRRNQLVDEQLINLNRSALHQNIDSEDRILFQLVAKLQRQVTDKHIMSLFYHRDVLEPLVKAYCNVYGVPCNYSRSGGVGVTIDNRTSFDAIAGASLDSMSKRILLRKVLNVLGDIELSDKTTYYEKYTKITGDSLILKELKSSYREEYQNENLILESPQGQTITLEKVIASCRDSIVYVEFWSAGNAASIKEIDDMAWLRKRFRNRPVAFVAITFDTVGWRRAIKRYAISGQHYVVTNTRASKFVRDLELYEVPRYIIYDKQGEIVNQRAPKPSRVELSKYL